MVELAPQNTAVAKGTAMVYTTPAKDPTQKKLFYGVGSPLAEDSTLPEEGESVPIKTPCSTSLQSIVQ